MQRDQLPTLHTRSTLTADAAPGRGLSIGATYTNLAVDQSAFHGLPELREQLHGGRAQASLRFPETPLEVAGFAGGLWSASRSPMPEYGLSMAWAPASAGDRPTVRVTVSGDFARRSELATATAIVAGIWYRELAGAAQIALFDTLTVGARATERFYSDQNWVGARTAFAMLRLLRVPQVHAGYSYSYSDSALNHWRATGATQDVAAGGYRYEFFYDPYFTPEEERGHLALASVQLAIGSRVTLGGKIVYPVRSSGRLRWLPESGQTPQPNTEGVFYEASGLLPRQAEAALGLVILERLGLRALFEYFEKPYYQYFAGSLHLRYAF